MRTIVGVAVMAILVSIVAVGAIAVTDEVDARVREVGGIAAEILLVVKVEDQKSIPPCAGPDVAHACQSSAG